ncbi:HAD-IIB family hydrolase [Synechococcus moorigangaii CMS01]|nr:HAD-IIB family hydrolase [Synechococcus moorigangaii CMS01]
MNRPPLPRYLALISIHGLIRSCNLELGRDADTGGQTKYVVELAAALAQYPEVEQVDLITKQIIDPQVSSDYGRGIEPINEKARIVRISAGIDDYIPKEELWDYLDNFADNTLTYFNEQPRLPDLIHSHYADAGYVGVRLANHLGIPLFHTGHSLGRSKRKRLLASGLKGDVIEARYHLTRRINAEEETLASATRVITSTQQEIDGQYAQYDFYHPENMRVIPPGTDLQCFYPPLGDEWQGAVQGKLARFLKEPQKPIILALSRLDQRKNIISLIRAFGLNPGLQAQANLVIFSGTRADPRDLSSSAQAIFTDLLWAIDRYNLYGKVAYPKFLSPQEIGELYRLASLSHGVFVNPALTEPFGLTLIEAAASGLPIVATEDGGPVDILENCQNGYLVNPLDPQDIAAKIAQILEDRQLWQVFSQRGLANVQRTYTWDSHVRRYMQVVQSILNRTESRQELAIARRPAMYHQGAIVSTIDQNLVGDPVALEKLVNLLNQHRKEIAFCIATGRRLDAALQVLREHNIPQPDVLMSSLGTEIYYAPQLTPDQAWSKHIDYLWNRQRVVDLLMDLPGLQLQPKQFQSTFKISYFYDPAIAPSIEEIKRILFKNDQTVNVIFSFGQYLDVVPIRASKGYALRWFAEQWEIPLTQILTVGGSGADEDMMLGNSLSVVVKNRHREELSDLNNIQPIYFSDQEFAAGILDGLTHYDFLALCRASGQKNG